MSYCSFGLCIYCESFGSYPIKILDFNGKEIVINQHFCEKNSRLFGRDNCREFEYK